MTERMELNQEQLLCFFFNYYYLGFILLNIWENPITWT